MGRRRGASGLASRDFAWGEAPTYGNIRHYIGVYSKIDYLRWTSVPRGNIRSAAALAAALAKEKVVSARFWRPAGFGYAGRDVS
jgi:hypothetical protein